MKSEDVDFVKAIFDFESLGVFQIGPQIVHYVPGKHVIIGIVLQKEA